MATNAKSPMAQTSGQLSTFYVADMFFGVDVLDVQEVLRSQQMTPVPLAPDTVEGLINLRGQIVTAIDMRRRLMLPPHAEDQMPMNMVVRTSEGAVSLLVDEIGDVLDVDAKSYERTPDNLDPAARELIRGVYKLKGRVLLVLDTEKAVEVDCSVIPLNSRIDELRSDATPAQIASFAPISETRAADQAKPAPAQDSAKKKRAKSPPKNERRGA
jgi:purine-binding chemotaxis protein CheW